MTDSTISIVAIGGSTRPDSASERAVRLAARGAQEAGAHVTTITGRELMLPIYDTEASDRTPQALALVEAMPHCMYPVRRASTRSPCGHHE